MIRNLSLQSELALPRFRLTLSISQLDVGVLPRDVSGDQTSPLQFPPRRSQATLSPKCQQSRARFCASWLTGVTRRNDTILAVDKEFSGARRIRCFARTTLAEPGEGLTRVASSAATSSGSRRRSPVAFHRRCKNSDVRSVKVLLQVGQRFTSISLSLCSYVGRDELCLTLSNSIAVGGELRP